MIILAHRGWWKTPEEKNSPAAFDRAFRHGYGVELDVRDFQGLAVISHDPPRERGMLLADVLEIYNSHGCTAPIAVNVKADGLQEPVIAALAEHRVENYFMFDMAVPDAVGYIRSRAKVFTRQSEYEPVPAFLDHAAGVWLDAFDTSWAGAAVIEEHLAAGRAVALVSPELHRRDPRADWEFWRAIDVRNGDARNDSGGLMLCTDFPDQAEAFFRKPG